MRLSIAFVLIASIAEAKDLRSGDIILTADEIRSDVVGRTHTFFDGGKSFFSVTDSYTYTYPNGGIAYGRYELGGPGEVCTFFNHGFERCDTYVRAGDRLVLIDAAGQRFPVREVN